MKLLNQKIFALGLALALTVSSVSVQASESLNIAFVNFKTCVEKSKMGEQEQGNFENLKNQMEGVMEEKEKTLSEIAKKFNDPDYIDSLSADAEAELKHQFRNLNQELNQQQSQYYQALQQANFKIIQKITELITKASDEVAKSKGYDVILNEEGAFFNSSKLDISNEIIAVMDQMYEKEVKGQN